MGVKAEKSKTDVDFKLGVDYPRPIVPPLNVEIDLDNLPVAHQWGDTPEGARPHIWGTPGTGKEGGSARPSGSRPGKGKGKNKRQEPRQEQFRGPGLENRRKKQRDSLESYGFGVQSWGA